MSSTVLSILPFFGANLVAILLGAYYLRHLSKKLVTGQLDKPDTGYQDGYQDGYAAGHQAGIEKTVHFMLQKAVDD